MSKRFRNNKNNRPQPKLVLGIRAESMTKSIKILWQDPRFMNGRKGMLLSLGYKASNGIEIRSSSMPEINRHTFFLRGINHTKHDHVVEAGPSLVERIMFALQEWANNWEGWNGKRLPRDQRPNLKELKSRAKCLGRELVVIRGR